MNKKGAGVKATRILVYCTISMVFILFGATWASAGGTSWHTPVPDTGQTTSYTDTYGEDSDYTTNPRSYTKLDANGNDLPDTATSWVMVRDNVTGLIWEVKTDDFGVHYKDNKYTWYDSNPATNGGDAGTPGDGTDTEDFINALNSAGFGGYADWRLPSQEELTTIVDYGVARPSVNTSYFPNTSTFFYWSSTTYADRSADAWYVSFHGVNVYNEHKYYSFHVRAVRGGQSTSGTLVDNGDGTITDTTTGLMWQQGEGGVMAWENALTYCENLNLAGYSDWRLPNVNELHSLVDSSKYNPVIDTTKFPDASESFYRSSTTAAQDTECCAWVVSFSSGLLGYGYKSSSYYVRAVRGGQPGSFGHLDIFWASVYDSATGDPIAGAIVKLGDNTQTTDQNGQAEFQDLKLGDYSVEITASGYSAYQTQITLSRGGSSEVRYGLVPASTGNRPVVTNVVSKYSNRDKAAYFLNGVDFNLPFTALIDWNGQTPGQVRFNNVVVSPDVSGHAVHAFNMGQDFGPGDRLTVVAVSQDGVESYPFDANVEVTDLPPGIDSRIPPTFGNSDFSYDFHISLGGTVTQIVPESKTAVPEEIPIFGGKEVSFVTKCEFDVSIGSDGTATYAVVRPKTDKNAFKMAGIPFDMGWNMGGKIEYQYHDHQWKLNGGFVTIDISAEAGVGPSYMVVPFTPPIPVYLRGEVGVGLDSQLGITGWAEDQWQLSGTVEPGASGKVITGMGVSGALAVEGYWAIDASMEFGFPQLPFYRKATVALSGGATLVMLFYKYEQPLLEYTWSWPDGSAQDYYSTATENVFKQDIMALDWRPIPRDYSNGKGTNIEAMTVLSMGYDVVEGTLPGQTNIYPYSTPTMVGFGNDLLLTWITDDQTKTDNNRTSVIYSRYTDNQWSEPVKVVEDGTADFYPDMASLGNGAVMSWQNSGSIFEDNATVEEIMAGQEISVCLYNGDNDTWEAGTKLTDNTYLDRSPAVAAANGKSHCCLDC